MNTPNEAALARHNGHAPAPVQQARPSFAEVAAEHWKIAESMAQSDIIPKDFRGKPANVFVALEMAHRLGLGPMEAMQNLYVVHGTPSMSAKFLIALANRSGRFRGGLQFREAKDAVTCFAVDRETNSTLEVTVTMKQAQEAGWTKNAKYKEMPLQMLSYRAATFFVRRYCPEVSLGFVTVDEAQEMPREAEVESPILEDMNARIASVDAPKAETVPEAKVAKLVAAFEKLGLDREYVAEKFGPLETMTLAQYDEACAEGAERRKAWEAEQRAAAEEPEPDAALFGADGEEESSYD